MTPWELAKKTEHSHQRALFAWANCVAQYGFYVAQYTDTYNKEKRETWFNWARVVPAPVPELSRLFAVHNQGHGDAVRGGRAKAEGVKAGVPDVMLPVPRRYGIHGDIRFAGLFIELKLPRYAPSDIKPAQHDWREYLNEAGYVSKVAGGWIDAANTIADYMGASVRLTDGP